VPGWVLEWVWGLGLREKSLRQKFASRCQSATNARKDWTPLEELDEEDDELDEDELEDEDDDDEWDEDEDEEDDELEEELELELEEDEDDELDEEWDDEDDDDDDELEDDEDELELELELDEDEDDELELELELELDEDGCTTYSGAYGIPGVVIIAGVQVIPSSREITRLGGGCSFGGFFTSNVMTLKIPIRITVSCVAHMYRMRFCPSHVTDPLVAPCVSPGMVQNRLAAGPPNGMVLGDSPARPVSSPCIANAGVCVEREYSVRGYEPLTSTPVCRVMVMVFVAKVQKTLWDATRAENPAVRMRRGSANPLFSNAVWL